MALRRLCKYLHSSRNRSYLFSPRPARRKLNNVIAVVYMANKCNVNIANEMRLGTIFGRLILSTHKS